MFPVTDIITYRSRLESGEGGSTADFSPGEKSLSDIGKYESSDLMLSLRSSESRGGTFSLSGSESDSVGQMGILSGRFGVG